MEVRELIAQLIMESDMSSPVYVLVIDNQTGAESFHEVDGIARYENSYQPGMRTYTTLEISG